MHEIQGLLYIHCKYWNPFSNGADNYVNKTREKSDLEQILPSVY